ncbi:MAG: homoserine kinase [Alphaproteobacteria bacterium]|nr:homoserine kinase [Alphaproteobacteria bacterium]
MAVYTPVDRKALQIFVSEYAIGPVVVCVGIAEGRENTNFRLTTGEGVYILTLFEKRTGESDLPFFLGLMDHLAGKGVRCPVPVRRKDGGVLGRLCGKPAAIVTFMDGDWPRHPTAGQCRALGRALGELHLAGLDFPQARPDALGADAWRNMLDACEGRGDSVVAGLTEELTLDLTILERDWPRGLPAGVVHGDLFPDNVFFRDGAISGIIDFYFAGTNALAYDLAVCLNAWCFDAKGAFDADKGRAMLAGYRDARPLDEDEVRALPMLARGAAMRFLLTRLFDWLNAPAGGDAPPKDPREYLRILRFHRAVADARDYGWEGP